MIETFEYSFPQRTIRKKTFSPFQRLVLSTLWIPVTLLIVGGIYLQNTGKLPAGVSVLSIVTFAPLFLSLIVFMVMAKHPKGPEKDFELPSIEIDPADSSLIRGNVATVEGQIREVEVAVPTVYGEATTIFEDSAPGEGSARLALEEMFDMALAEVQKKYPHCTWDRVPTVKQLS